MFAFNEVKYIMRCIAPNKTPLSKLLRPFHQHHFILILSSFWLLPTDVKTFTFSMHNPHCHYHYLQSKLQLWEEMRNNTDLICYPKTRDTCIYVGIRARFCLTMQYGHTEMKMPCVALSPSKHNHHNHPALKKRSGNPGSAGNFTPA